MDGDINWEDKSFYACGQMNCLPDIDKEYCMKAFCRQLWDFSYISPRAVLYGENEQGETEFGSENAKHGDKPRVVSSKAYKVPHNLDS